MYRNYTIVANTTAGRRRYIQNFITALVTLVASSVIQAQPSDDMTDSVRPVLSAWTVGMGSSHITDTYLSPLKYSGWSTSAGYERMQATKWWPHEWVMQLKLGIDLERTENPARNATMWGAQLHVSWGMMRRWTLPCGLRLGIGPALNADGGCLYNKRNSNNPASAKGAVTLDATGYAAMDIRLCQLPVTLRWQSTTAVIGAFFSPRYDELYYEIYLGNRTGLVHPAWWGNRFKLDNLITTDLHFGPTSLRIGYGCDWMSSKVSNITTRFITHRFVVGVTTEWLGFDSTRKRNLERARVITAF